MAITIKSDVARNTVVDALKKGNVGENMSKEDVGEHIARIRSAGEEFPELKKLASALANASWKKAKQAIRRFLIEEGVVEVDIENVTVGTADDINKPLNGGEQEGEMEERKTQAQIAWEERQNFLREVVREHQQDSVGELAKRLLRGDGHLGLEEVQHLIAEEISNVEFEDRVAKYALPLKEWQAMEWNDFRKAFKAAWDQLGEGVALKKKEDMMLWIEKAGLVSLSEEELEEIRLQQEAERLKAEAEENERLRKRSVFYALVAVLIEGKPSELAKAVAKGEDVGRFSSKTKGVLKGALSGPGIISIEEMGRIRELSESEDLTVNQVFAAHSEYHSYIKTGKWPVKEEAIVSEEPKHETPVEGVKKPVEEPKVDKKAMRQHAYEVAVTALRLKGGGAWLKPSSEDQEEQKALQNLWGLTDSLVLEIEREKLKAKDGEDSAKKRAIFSRGDFRKAVVVKALGRLPEDTKVALVTLRWAAGSVESAVDELLNTTKVDGEGNNHHIACMGLGNPKREGWARVVVMAVDEIAMSLSDEIVEAISPVARGWREDYNERMEALNNQKTTSVEDATEEPKMGWREKIKAKLSRKAKEAAEEPKPKTVLIVDAPEEPKAGFFKRLWQGVTGVLKAAKDTVVEYFSNGGGMLITGSLVGGGIWTLFMTTYTWAFYGSAGVLAVGLSGILTSFMLMSIGLWLSFTLGNVVATFIQLRKLARAQV